MRLTPNPRKRPGTVSVEYALAVVTWNAADPKTRGPRPVDKMAVKNGGGASRSPWRTQTSLPRVLVPVGER